MNQENVDPIANATDVDVVIPSKDQTRVFVNNRGGITIHQTSNLGEESFIAIDASDVAVICRALRLAAKEAKR